MSFRSSSSSPDILGPPGDVEYLVSSPFKPFPGRQSVMSPANFKLLQTPRFAKSRRRISLSPTKSSHSIRFDDVVLPGSPSRTMSGRQKPFSPEMVQPDGNVSPWRIRVTLEATQDEEMNQGSPSRKRPRNSAMTTKVPLKDEADTMEQTPRKRRGARGSASAQKRKRGRPRKYLPAPEDNIGAQVANSQIAEPSVVEPEPSWDPLNLAADGESDDGLPDDQGYAEPFEGDVQMEQLDNNPQDQSHQSEYERTYDTPNVDYMDDAYMQNDENIHSTPSKMPSPSRESQIISPDNTIYAGRTPRPARLYPTPTSSSLVDEERQDRGAQSSVSRNRFRESGVHATNDPTDEHREFDSIMESEGFSMVSLDTLPSAKQHGLSASSQVAKGALKPFLERESNGVLRRKSSIRNQANEEDAGLITQAEPSTLAQEKGTVDFRHARTYPPPTSPAPVPVQTSTRGQRRPMARLVRLVRVGIALESALRRPYDRGYPRGLLSSPDIHESQEQISSLETSRKRLELLFGEFDSEIQRDLQSALKFGQELAKRRVQAEIENVRKVSEMETIAETTPKG
ncbi:AT DNA binding protein [Aspergillus bombycis]|uniref:AT DNA binding protein n=1 Tax=Aspergillus bombycis TaxID=109264 RepID=A0A1F7ZL17_9EURO|nr:AT DNA binding protein [Aspergillus bombycis]OGM40157.1 AT DNA binding protein [Aspergillus bombycis]